MKDAIREKWGEVQVVHLSIKFQYPGFSKILVLTHQVIWPGDVVYAERFCQKGGDEVTFLVNLVVFDLRQTRFWKGLKRFGVDEIVDVSYIWYETILSWQCFSEDDIVDV